VKMVPVAAALTVVFVRAAFQGSDSGAARAKVSRSQIGCETVGTDKWLHSPKATVRVSGGSASTYPTCDAASAPRLRHPDSRTTQVSVTDWRANCCGWGETKCIPPR